MFQCQAVPSPVGQSWGKVCTRHGGCSQLAVNSESGFAAELWWGMQGRDVPLERIARKEMFILTPLGRQAVPGYQRGAVPVFQSLL